MSGAPTRPVEDSLSRTIGAIYDAAMVPGLWPAALRHLREDLGTASTVYIAHNADRTRIDRVAAEVDPDGHKANVDLLLRDSVAYRRGPKGYPGQIIRVSDLVPSNIFEQSSMYQEYWRPRALFDGLRLTIAVDAAGNHHALNLLRPKSADLFGDQEIGLAQRLMPHLQRAIELSQRLRNVDMLSAAALTALDILRHPVLLLDQDSRLLHANASGEALLRAADGLLARQGVLSAVTQPQTNQLHTLLANAAGLGGRTLRAGVLRLRRQVGGAPLALLAMPFRHETHWSLPRRPAILLCVTDLGAATPLPGRHLGDLFGLTSAEASLAGDLLTGQELREIAERRGRSVNTIRTHLAKLMAKTNVNRQSELMRMLASLPRLGDSV